MKPMVRNFLVVVLGVVAVAIALVLWAPFSMGVQKGYEQARAKREARASATASPAK